MLLPESSTNSWRGVFPEPRGLNKQLQKAGSKKKKRKKKGRRRELGETNEMASQQLKTKKSAAFSNFNQKQRRPAVERAWWKKNKKTTFTWAKSLERGGRVGWWGRAETNKQTTTDEQLQSALQRYKGGEEGEKEEPKNGRTTFQRNMEIWSSFHDSVPTPSFFPALSKYPFPNVTLLCSCGRFIKAC